MRIKRDIINKLKEWKDAEKRKPILLKGARQIGKTWAMEEFGREYFDYTAKFDFDRQKELQSAFTVSNIVTQHHSALETQHIMSLFNEDEY